MGTKNNSHKGKSYKTHHKIIHDYVEAKRKLIENIGILNIEEVEEVWKERQPTR